jgi:hypothetical protein
MYVGKNDFKLNFSLLDVSQAYIHLKLFQNYSRELSNVYFGVRNYAL